MPDSRPTHDPAPVPQAPPPPCDGPLYPLTSLLEPHDSRRSRNLVVAIDKYLAVSLDLISPANLAPIFAQLAHDQPELVEALTARLRASVEAKATVARAGPEEAGPNYLGHVRRRTYVGEPTPASLHVMTPAQIDEAVRVATKRTHAEELRAKVDELETKILSAQASIDLSGPESVLANSNASDMPVP
ncbi:hypothetical protein GGF31_000188 [Allomyces arbusculus]|nr:hypothetical protein GGF31_000188 [Allomyces arbusculus]